MMRKIIMILLLLIVTNFCAAIYDPPADSPVAEGSSDVLTETEVIDEPVLKEDKVVKDKKEKIVDSNDIKVEEKKKESSKGKKGEKGGKKGEKAGSQGSSSTKGKKGKGGHGKKYNNSNKVEKGKAGKKEVTSGDSTKEAKVKGNKV